MGLLPHTPQESPSQYVRVRGVTSPHPARLRGATAPLPARIALTMRSGSWGYCPTPRKTSWGYCPTPRKNRPHNTFGFVGLPPHTPQKAVDKTGAPLPPYPRGSQCSQTSRPRPKTPVASTARHCYRGRSLLSRVQMGENSFVVFAHLHSGAPLRFPRAIAPVGRGCLGKTQPLTIVWAGGSGRSWLGLLLCGGSPAPVPPRLATLGACA